VTEPEVRHEALVAVIASFSAYSMAASASADALSVGSEIKLASKEPFLDRRAMILLINVLASL